MSWYDVLRNAVTTSLFLAILAFFAKKVIKNWLAKSLEKYKFGLQLAAFEHRTRFTKLHEQRAAAITELYQRMDRIRQLWEASVRPLRFHGEPTPEEQHSQASRLSMELQEFYYQHRLFFDPDLCQSMEDLFRANWDVLLEIGAASTLESPGPYADPAAVAARTMLLNRATEVIVTKLPPAILRVEATMKSMLGISESGK